MLEHAIILSLIAGLTIPLGAWLTRVRFFPDNWKRMELRHAITAMGAGALISAIAFVLVPDGAEKQPAWSVMATFALGSLVFMGIDIALARSKTRASDFVAMLIHFVPEAIVLGAVVTQSFKEAILLTIIIAAQNLPEGFAAYLELEKGGRFGNKLWGLFVLVGLSGPIYILLGTEVFVHSELALGMLMSFCAGGILYLVFEDIAPRIAMEKHWLPPLGAVAGFMIGMAGHLYIH